MSKAKKEGSAKRQRTRPVAKTNPTTAAFDVSDELGAVLEPLIPEHVNTHRFGGGRPRVPDRKCAKGIFSVLRTGGQGKALDKTGLCSGSTAPLRFQAGVEAGVFLQFWKAGLEQ
jgi:putative transposase